MSDTRAVNSLDQLRESVEKLPDRLAAVLQAGREQATTRTDASAPDRAGGLEKIAQGLRGTPVLDQLAVGMARGRAIREGIAELTGSGKRSSARASAAQKAADRAAAKATKGWIRASRAALKKAEQQEKQKQRAANPKGRSAKPDMEKTIQSEAAKLRKQGFPADFAENMAKQYAEKLHGEKADAGPGRSSKAAAEHEGGEAGDKDTSATMKKLTEEVKKLTEELGKQRQKAGGSGAPVPGNAPAEQTAQPGAGPRVNIRRRERPAPPRPEQPNPRGGALTAVRQTQARSG